VKLDKFCKKPKENFVKAQTGNTDDGKNQKFHVPLGYGPLGKDPEDAQRVVGEQAKSESGGCRDKIVDLQIIRHQVEGSEVDRVGTSADHCIPEELDVGFMTFVKKKREKILNFPVDCRISLMVHFPLPVFLFDFMVFVIGVDIPD
jgi:hypothetical protein